MFGWGKSGSGGGSKSSGKSTPVPGTSYKGARSVPHSTHKSGKTSQGSSRIKK